MRLTFDSRHRVGLRGAYIVRLDVAKRRAVDGRILLDPGIKGIYSSLNAEIDGMKQVDGDRYAR